MKRESHTLDLWALYAYVRKTLTKNPDCNLLRMLKASEPKDGAKIVKDLAYMGGFIYGQTDRCVKEGEESLQRFASDIGGDYDTILSLSVHSCEQGIVEICGLSLISWYTCPCELHDRDGDY